MTNETLSVFTGHLWDGLSDTLLRDAAVAVRGDTVVFAGPRGALDIPETARVTETGGVLLPGLIDLHVHARPGYLGWFLAAGVTTIRDAANSLDLVAALRGAQDPSPRVFAAGPLLDGPRAFFRQFGPGAVHEAGDGHERRAGAWTVRHPDEARAQVRRLADLGVTHVKLYEQLDPQSFAAAAAEARRLGLPVMTDLGLAGTRGLSGAEVDARQALAAGVRSIEHVSGYALAYRRMGGDPLGRTLDPARLGELAARTVAAGTALVPTLSVHEGLAEEDAPDLGQLPLGTLEGPVMAALRAQWARTHPLGAGARRVARADRRMAHEMLRRVAALGGTVGAGTDTPASAFNLPGGGLHRELELLVAAGLSPLQALKGATSAAARILERPDLGVLRPGALADFVVVAGNPLEDVRRTRELRLVVRGGQALSPDALRDTAAAHDVPAQLSSSGRVRAAGPGPAVPPGSGTP